MTLRIGLTGGIACGKSEVSRCLLEFGIPVLDTDRVAHDAMLPGEPVYRQIVDYFGEDILQPSGLIDRKRLGARVFSDPKELAELNARVHPEVGRCWRNWLNSQKAEMAVVVIPLLFECGLENEFDGVLTVWSPETLIRERLRDRGWSAEEAEARIRAQWPVDTKRERATWTLRNHTTLSDLNQRLNNWLRNDLHLENLNA